MLYTTNILYKPTIPPNAKCFPTAQRASAMKLPAMMYNEVVSVVRKLEGLDWRGKGLMFFDFFQ